MVGGFDVRSTGMPRETQYDGPIAPILILIMLLQALRNRIVHTLIIFKLGREGLGAPAVATKQFLILAVEEIASATHSTEAEEPEYWTAAAPPGLGRGRVSVAATLPLLAEGLAEGLTAEVTGGTASGAWRPEGGVEEGTVEYSSCGCH